MYFSIVAYQRVTIKSSDLTGDDFVETIAQKGPDDFFRQRGVHAFVGSNHWMLGESSFSSTILG